MGCDKSVVTPDPETLAACFGRKSKKRTDQITGILATLKSKNPPIVELDSAAMAAYVRFSRRKESRPALACFNRCKVAKILEWTRAKRFEPGR